jgi:hypothetical protein
VIVHQHPGVNKTLPVRNLAAQPIEEILLVFLLYEDRRPVDSPHHDMVQSAGNVKPGLPGHETNLPRSQEPVKC